eukprot:4378760-Pleurochrysis_carterae.AAC.1
MKAAPLYLCEAFNSPNTKAANEQALDLFRVSQDLLPFRGHTGIGKHALAHEHKRMAVTVASSSHACTLHMQARTHAHVYTALSQTPAH